MLVMSAMSGSTSRARLSISPAWSMPSSTTHTSCCASSLSRVRGTPMSLLKFPSVLWTQNLAPSTAAVISLVVVFPTEPVTAIKGMGNSFL
jgi:hypothetical protein